MAMNLDSLVGHIPHWLSGADDLDGIVLSCRARLARNLAVQPFSGRASAADQERVIQQVLGAAQRSRLLCTASFYPMEALEVHERRLLVERHLVSPALAEGRGLRGVLFNKNEILSVMINEEDHLRIQAILPGLNARRAWAQVDALDDELGSSLNYAHSGSLGYLTACPTNVGTGLRISVLVHLPGLVLAEDMERVMRGLTQMAFTVRGFYGEGTHAAGNLFQVSNQTTLGRAEEEIVSDLARLARRLAECEREAQETLLENARSEVEDKIWRAYGILSHARVLSSQEFMNLLSALRLGYTLGLLREVPSGFMNQLMIFTQPSHLQAELSRKLEPGERDVRRAEWVRRRLAAQRAGEGGAP